MSNISDKRIGIQGKNNDFIEFLTFFREFKKIQVCLLGVNSFFRRN